ncbi:MAG: undecaprenyl-diphosphate phosphatase [Alphaproteobacteria bacterium]|nr:undecaprenyl-diphosphate phosphatase [Alphaproteobacteria bacterium]
MSLMTYFHACILGLVEGATEFLPVSSTGHLILAQDALGFSLASANMFTVVIQLGAILAVCWLYRARITDVVFHLNDKKQQFFALRLFVAFLPAAVIGLLFHNAIEEKLFNPIVVAVMLVIGGVIIWLVEKFKPAPVTHDIDSMTFRQAFWVGCAQAVSVIPGTSRSGATIIGGLLLKLDRKVATEFSFFLAMPVMVCATGLDIYKYHDVLTLDEIWVILTGFVVSFFAGLVAVKFLVGYVGKHDFIPFAIYRILFGLVLLGYYLA